MRGRTPFAVLVVVLLAAGLLGLLALNTALNEGSFELSRLQKQTTKATDEQQSLQHEIDQSSAPDALARRAGELGMVPAGGMAFLDVPNGGKVLGTPGSAKDSPPVKKSTVEPWPMKQPSPGAQSVAPAQPSAAPSASPSAQPSAQPTSQAPAPPPTPAASAGDSVIQLNPVSSAPAQHGGGTR
ncbi:FtsB/FtsL family cell division protein [Kitasatospora cathayae]|uniref:Cell division protein FtsL n=1 Tax=Kitasatospora cathayae TaxID=3004092 RepID=A0ABY7Q9F8_9ACTN|nr:cell division protein FtsL [Kitasatospora sp. HUAS 3-15]WBP89287.1 cell division protein FtsL [Kitasatospora sp. HUAS 3-15]